MNWNFIRIPAFWTAVFAAITIVVAAWKPELRETLVQLAPLLVTIIVAVAGGSIANTLGKAYVQAQAIQAGRVLPEELKKVA
jgi:hypothetical protein